MAPGCEPLATALVTPDRLPPVVASGCSSSASAESAARGSRTRPWRRRPASSPRSGSTPGRARSSPYAETTAAGSRDRESRNRRSSGSAWLRVPSPPTPHRAGEDIRSRATAIRLDHALTSQAIKHVGVLDPPISHRTMTQRVLIVLDGRGSRRWGPPRGAAGPPPVDGREPERSLISVASASCNRYRFVTRKTLVPSFEHMGCRALTPCGSCEQGGYGAASVAQQQGFALGVPP
jgi:hypothetical protein